MSKKPDPTEDQTPQPENDRFGWSSLDQINPLNARGEPLDAAELAELRAYKALQTHGAQRPAQDEE